MSQASQECPNPVIGEARLSVTQSTTEHEAQALRVLSMFQTLELCLKIYIAGAYKLIKKALNGKLPFNYDYRDIENHPLERLLKLFTKLNDDSSLHVRLNKLAPKRNLVAHRALVYRHEVVADLFNVDRDALLVDLKAMEKELNECLVLLQPSLDRMIESNTAPKTAA